MNRKEWNDKYPVRRLMTPGKWGFLRVSDCLDMRQCEYDTQRQAQAARAREFREHQKLESEEAAVGNHADRNER